MCAYLLEAGRRKRWRRVELQAETESARGACLDLLSLCFHPSAPDHPTNPRAPAACAQPPTAPAAAAASRSWQPPCCTRTQIIPSPALGERKTQVPPRPPTPFHLLYAPRAKSNTHSHKHPAACLRVYMQFILHAPLARRALKIQESRALFCIMYFIYVCVDFSCATRALSHQARCTSGNKNISALKRGAIATLTHFSKPRRPSSADALDNLQRAPHPPLVPPLCIFIECILIFRACLLFIFAIT